MPSAGEQAEAVGAAEGSAAAAHLTSRVNLRVRDGHAIFGVGKTQVPMYQLQLQPLHKKSADLLWTLEVLLDMLAAEIADDPEQLFALPFSEEQASKSALEMHECKALSSCSELVRDSPPSCGFEGS